MAFKPVASKAPSTLCCTEQMADQAKVTMGTLIQCDVCRRVWRRKFDLREGAYWVVWTEDNARKLGLIE